MQFAELPEFAGLSQLDDFLEGGYAPALRTGLENASSLCECLGNALAIADRDAARLLAIDVLAGLRGNIGRGRMPTISGGNDHRIDVVSGQHFAEVPVELAVFVSVVFVDKLLTGIAPGSGISTTNSVYLNALMGHGFFVMESLPKSNRSAVKMRKWDETTHALVVAAKSLKNAVISTNLHKHIKLKNRPAPP